MNKPLTPAPYLCHRTAFPSLPFYHPVNFLTHVNPPFFLSRSSNRHHISAKIWILYRRKGAQSHNVKLVIDRQSIDAQICKLFQNLGRKTLGPVVHYYGLEAKSHKVKLQFFEDNGAFRHGETQETQLYSLVEVPSPTGRMGLKHLSSQVDIWPVLRAAEFHGTSDIKVLGTGSPEPLLVSLLRFSSIPLHPSWANRPWRNWALLLNILELPHDASTIFDSIALAPLMFSNPPCAMEAHEDPCSSLVVKQKVSLYELFPNKMELLFAIEVATVREMHGEIVLSCISKAFM